MNEHLETEKDNIAHENVNEDYSEPEILEQNETEKQIAELQKKVEELQNELALVRADSYNYRQRVEKEKARLRASISEDRILDFIPVLDNLDRALNVPEDSTAGDVLKGVKMVQKQFLSVLQELGVEVIVSIKNEELFEFNPLLHDAVSTEEVSDPNLDGIIIEELLRGYRTKERVIRPAQVRVGKMAATSIKE